MAANDSVFEIGLAMAGAISAGAYSAGVTDFLFQALEEWERLKREKPDTVPNHSVCIRAAAGASAGSITAALAAVAIAGGLQKEAFAVPQAGRQRYRCVLPALYTAWVTMPDMASPEGAPDLLSNSDLEDGDPPRSLLNAQVLESLTEMALRLPGPQGEAPAPPAYGGDGLPYLAKRLHLYLTLSNMRGVPYRVDFKGDGTSSGHYMMSHGDRAHYVIENIGTHEGENSWLSSDPKISLRIDTAPQGGGELDPAWRAYGLTALASAAFPVGLAARPIASSTGMYEKRSWPGPQTTGEGFSPSWPSDWGANREFGFMSVDGGLIDNEPFEYARRAIMPKGRESNDRSAATAPGAVLLVDPFPEPPDFSAEDELDASIVQVARSLLPMLKNQVRFKPDELAAVLDKECSSRWMIAPSRQKAVGDAGERYAIATGVLGGFGGFLDESFRAHDYQLGRRNCQRFLQKVFVVADDNPIVCDMRTEEGNQTKTLKWPQAAFDNPDFRELKDDGKYYCPVIPVVGDAVPEVALPTWPRIDAARLSELEGRIAARADYVVPKLIASTSMSSWKRWALRLLWSTAAKGPFMDFVHASIESDLIRRDQLADWSSLGESARLVLAELTAPGFDYRTVNGAKGICRATHMNEAEVRSALGQLRNAHRDLVWSGQVGNQECWTLMKHRPGWLARNNPLGGEPSIG
jgi:hypothetical protein